MTKALLVLATLACASQAQANSIIDSEYKVTGAAADLLYASLRGKDVERYVSIEKTHVKRVASGNAAGHYVDLSCVKEEHVCSFKETHDEPNEW